MVFAGNNAIDATLPDNAQMNSARKAFEPVVYAVPDTPMRRHPDASQQEGRQGSESTEK
jgi:hypothetical protein